MKLSETLAVTFVVAAWFLVAGIFIGFKILNNTPAPSPEYRYELYNKNSLIPLRFDRQTSDLHKLAPMTRDTWILVCEGE